MRAREQPGVIAAYILIVVVGVLGFNRLEQVNARQCRSNQNVWQSAHDLTIAVTEPIAFVGGDAAALARTNARNRQLARQRDSLLTDQGKRPSC